MSQTALGTPCSAASSWRPIAVQTAMALLVIVLFTLTVAALEAFLLGNESLSALDAVIGG